MSELAERLAVQTGMSKRDAQQFLSAVVETIQEGVNNDKIVKIKGLGTFKVIDVDARESINVNTGERVTIDSHQKLTFTPDSAMKELVNKPFSQFETVVLNDGVDFSDSADSEVNTDSEDNTDSEVNADSETNDESEANTDSIENVDSTEEEIVPEETITTDVVEETQEEMPQPVASEDPAPEVVVEEANEENIEDTYEPAEVENNMTVPPSTRSYWWLWLLVGIIACVGSFIGGIFFERYVDFNIGLVDKNAKADSVITTPAPVVTPQDMLKTDTLQLDSTKLENKEVIEQPKKVETAELSQKAEATPDWKKYEDMDARVRTGAYRIVGLDRTVKVKAGDTLKRIAKRTLGEGMECYVEVFNNITSNQSLKEGQDINIPKLELKKKHKKE